MTLNALQADTFLQYGQLSWRRRLFRVPLNIFHRLATQLAGVDFPWQTQISPGLALTHGWGTVISAGAVIGRNVTLFHGVTLGRRDRITQDGGRQVGYPVIEDDVWIGPHAVIVGAVTVGQGSRIAAGAFVVENVPAHCVVSGNPAVIVKTQCAPDVMNRLPNLS